MVIVRPKKPHIPLERRNVPCNRWRTLRAAAEAGIALDACAMLKAKRDAAYEARVGAEGPCNYAARMRENMAYVLPPKAKPKFAKLAKLSPTRGHTEEYLRAVHKLARHL